MYSIYTFENNFVEKLGGNVLNEVQPTINLTKKL